tara:strand:+ start:72 stop:737 length:666 start_codon:yes stop_codon:yes gene_type:complete
MRILKITLIAVISSVLMVLPSNAVEKRLGISASFIGVSADGTETQKDSSKKSNTEASETGVIPSIFAEISTDGGLGLGVEYVPGTADINSAARSRSDDDEETTGDNKASADIDGLTSVYIIKTFESGLFFKVGQTSTTVNTTEVLATGSKYGNVDIDGTVLSIGVDRTTDNGMFFRVSGEYTDYDDISLTSQTADAVTGTKNKIDATLDTAQIKLAIGKAF